MNDLIYKLFAKHDSNLFEYVKQIIKLELFVKLPYQAQIGIVDFYLFEVNKCAVLIDEGKSIVFYYSSTTGHYVRHVIEKDVKDLVSAKLVGYNYLLINKYLPF